MRRWLTTPILLIALAIGTVLCTACPNKGGGLKAPAGKGGLPTNNLKGMNTSGTVGGALSVPAEAMYPGAKEIEQRPGYYQTDGSVDTVLAWLLANLPDAGEREADVGEKLVVNPDWTVEVYESGGKAVLHYKNNKLLGKQVK